VAARRGSPLLIGVKTDRKLKVDFVDVELADTERGERAISLHAFLQGLLANMEKVDEPRNGLLSVPNGLANHSVTSGPKIRRSQSRAFMSEDGMPQPIEYFVASDASAVIEHTKRVLYLEDDDIAHIAEGGMSTSPSCCTG